MNRNKSIQKADQLMREVCENLRHEANEYDELFSVTEEWILFLTAAASNSETRKRFPMTPSDVSRTRKRVKIDSIAESVEEDEVMPLPEPSHDQPLQPVRRGSRTAFKLASMNMKEPNLNTKLRRPENTILEACDANSTRSEVQLPKRARKGKSNMPKANTSSATAESSFVSARDSLTSDVCQGVNVEPMETEDDIVLEKIQSTKISTFNNTTKKSSLRVKTVTLTRSSKRITKQLIETVVESPVKVMTMKKASTRQKAGIPVYDSDDDVPIINFVAKLSKPLKCEPGSPEIPTEIKSNPVKNKKESRQQEPGSTSAIATDVAGKKCGEETADWQVDTRENRNALAETPLQEAVPADISIVNSSIVQETPEKKIKTLKPKALSNATNRNTPEAIRNVLNRNFEPVSVKKRIEAIEQEHFILPVAPVKPDVPVRMTRTKVRAMMALSEKKTTQNMETSQLLKIARKSLMRANKISLAKDRSIMEAQKSVEKENTSPPQNRTKLCLTKTTQSTRNKTRVTPNSYVHPSRLLTQMSISKNSNNSPPRNAAKQFVSQSSCSTNNKNRTSPNNYVHPSRLLAQMSISKQPIVNLNSNISTFLPKTKVISAAEKAEEKRKEERRLRRENNDDALLKKKALIDDRTEQQRKKREEKERNVLAQKALKEQEKAEMKRRIEKENEEKAKLVQEREEIIKKEILRKKEEAKQKAAKIEERRVKQEAERLLALKLQEEEQQKLLAQKRKEQEDAERLHAKRMLEEKERKEKEAALKEASQKEVALKLEKQNQTKKVIPTKVLDATITLDKPALVAASKYDYPLADLSKGNDSDFSEGEEDVIPSWANREVLQKNLKCTHGIPIKALLCYFGSKPTTPDLNKIFSNVRNKHTRSSSAHWKTPPRCSILPNIL